MSDPINFDEYAEFLREADKDNRVGDHKFLVTDVSPGVWGDSHEEYIKIRGQLVTAGNAKADFNLQDPPTMAEIKEQSGSWEAGRKRGVAMGIGFLKNLANFYQKGKDDVQPGDTIWVKTTKNKDGFIRVVAILDPRVAEAKGKAAVDTSAPPF